MGSSSSTQGADVAGPSKPLAILSAPGSRGDVNPLIAIGRNLRQRGFDVTVSLAEPYAPLAEAAGLTPLCLISHEEFDRLLDRPGVWKPFTGLAAVLEGAAGSFLRPHFEAIERLKRPGRTILVSHPLDFASRIHRELDHQIGLVDVILSPAIIRNPAFPPRLTGWWLEPRRPAWLVNIGYWLGDHLLLDRLIGKSVNRLRRECGLQPIRRVLDRWWLSPDMMLSLYPDWFGPVRPIAGGVWHACGFPLRVNSELGGELLGNQNLPDPALPGTIFFTPGTAHRQAKAFFEQAVAACRRLGRPGILATSHLAQIPGGLPTNVCAVGYVPLEHVLSHCSAIVHHGGIGTTAHAIAAGCRQLVVPMAFDQFHNAERVVSLGLGHQLLGLAKNDLTAALTHLLDDPEIGQTCQRVSRRMGKRDGAEVAADHIVSLFREIGTTVAV